MQEKFLSDIQLGVVGAGAWGKHFLRNLAALGALKAVCELNNRHPNLLPYADIAIYDNYSHFLEQSDVTGVVIATPERLHYSMAKEALLAGKHVFVEKPLCLSYEQGVELNQLAQAHGLTLMVGHLLQYHPAFNVLKQSVAEGVIGDLRHIQCSRLNLSAFRDGVNVLWDLAPHDISMILSLTQALPESVSANACHFASAGIEGIASGHLTFVSGVTAQFQVSWLSPVKEQKCIVIGTEGMIVFDDTLPATEKLKLYEHKSSERQIIELGPVAGEVRELPFTLGEPLLEECRQFIDSIKTSVPAISCGDEAVAVLNVLQACQSSIQAGGHATLLSHPTADKRVYPELKLVT